jgi:hypothetical protein
MTRLEALALYNLEDNEDLAEQLEFVFFEYKQKIYRQLDQVLLYPKWFSALESLSNAAETLALPFDYHASLEFGDTSFHARETLIDQYNQLQQLKVKVAHMLYKSSAPQNVLEILEMYQRILKASFAFWSQSIDFNTMVKLSQLFDPIAILAALKSIEKEGVRYLHELQQHNTPNILKEWISWNKALETKLATH